MITIPEATIRGLSFAFQRPSNPPSGQQINTWVPSGQYVVVRVETVSVSFLGTVETHEAIRIEDDAHVFYVSATQLVKEGIEDVS